jgi:trehalose 6-phosphate phosphatase
MLHMETPDTSTETQKKVVDFLANASRTSDRALLMDYDGTLAPFCEDRRRAAPYPGVPALLDRIRRRGNTRVVVVTGRRATEVAKLLGLKGIEIWGCHGLSRLHASGKYEVAKLDEAALTRISEVNELLSQQGLLDLLEFKPAATAIHWRGMDPAKVKRVSHKVRSVWSMLDSRRGLDLLEFDGGLEIRLALRNKGNAVRAILAEMGDHPAIAYLGDDQTDEDAFDALRGRGLGVLVRKQYRSTIADVWIQPPDGVTGFLEDWAIACEGAL